MLLVFRKLFLKFNAAALGTPGYGPPSAEGEEEVGDEAPFFLE